MAEFAQAAVPRGALTSAEAYWWHRRWLKDGADKYDPRVIVRIRAGETVTAATYIDLIKLRERSIRTISAAATGSDAMLMPTTRDTAPTIAEAKSATPVAAKSDDKPATRSAFPDKPSIAVLPFANMSGDAEQEFRRRYLGRHHHRAVQALPDYRPQFLVHLQGQERPRRRGRKKPRRALRARGKRTQIRRSGQGDGAAHRRDDRRAPVG